VCPCWSASVSRADAARSERGSRSGALRQAGELPATGPAGLLDPRRELVGFTGRETRRLLGRPVSSRSVRLHSIHLMGTARMSGYPQRGVWGSYSRLRARVTLPWESAAISQAPRLLPVRSLSFENPQPPVMDVDADRLAVVDGVTAQRGTPPRACQGTPCGHENAPWQQRRRPGTGLRPRPSPAPRTPPMYRRQRPEPTRPGPCCHAQRLAGRRCLLRRTARRYCRNNSTCAR
jgi:hypothetical protein